MIKHCLVRAKLTVSFPYPAKHLSFAFRTAQAFNPTTSKNSYTQPKYQLIASMANQGDPSSANGVRSALEETDKKGSFARTEASHRNWIKKGSEFEPEAGRYHLYVCLACPWANRCLAVLNMKGLQDSIGVSVTHPTWQKTRPDKDQHAGWVFASPDDPPLHSIEGFGSFPCDGCIPDDVNGAKTVRDLYDLSNDVGGKYTVPVLWDKKLKCIVNNESSEILRMFNAEFQDLAKHPEIDLYPEELRGEIDAVNEWVYPTINNGVYRCGFAQSQEAYEEAYKHLFDSLDRVESILTKQRYICGDILTEADVRLFMTLIRFDPVYVVYFKTNKKFLREYPAISDYVRDLYQTSGIKESINIRHIKTHYFTSHPKLNHYAIIPVGADAWWEEPHNRNKLNKKPVAWSL